MSKYPTITIFTGISGIDKKSFIKKLIEKSGMKSKVLLINFEDELVNERRGPHIPIPDVSTFLDSPNNSLKLNEIASNFSWIAKAVQGRNPSITHIFLNIHLSYYKNSEFYPPMMPLYFKEIFSKLPDSKIQIINLIDDVFTIWKKITDRENSGYTNTKLSLREILAWRSLEFLRGEGLKEHVNISEEGSQRATHFMVSIRHPHSTFKNLIFNDSSFRVYLSYHISETRKSIKSIKEVNDFRKLMHKVGKDNNVSIFDPVAIDELSMAFALERKRKQSPKQKNEFLNFTQSERWPLDLTDLNASGQKFPIKLISSEIDEVGKDIANQIQSRDYTLVDTATYLAVYRPYYNKKLSKGVDAEIKRANETFSRVVVFHPKEDQDNGETASTHPFGSRATMYDDKKKFVKHLQKLIKENKKKAKK